MRPFVVAFLLCCLAGLAGATICQPSSMFRMDCNVCRCSQDGREYSCTDLPCSPRSKEDFVEELNDKGYVVLKPRRRDSGGSWSADRDRQLN